jgi:hypothetical protein
MANTSPVVNYTSLDFDKVRDDLLAYITSISTFSDHNQKGSNLNILVKILAYIENLLAYNLNKSVNEGYLETANLRENVLKLIKPLNYNPYRSKSSSVHVDISVSQTDGNAPFFLLKYDRISVGAINFYYVGPGVDVTSTMSALDVPFYEGTLKTMESALIGNGFNFQKFLIPDTNVGDFLSIYTLKNDGSRVEWAKFEEGKLYANPPQALIYFIEETVDGYQVMFGNGVLGKRVAINEQIGYDYLKPSITQKTYGLTAFKWTGKGSTQSYNTYYTGGTIKQATIVPTSAYSTGSLAGSFKETIGEIKFNAPKFFQTQGRAITESDYYALAINHEWIQDAIVVGGDKLTPYELGKVYITVKPDVVNYPNETFSVLDLTTLKNYFLQFSVVTINPIVQNPQYIYLVLDIITRHKTVAAFPSVTDVKNAVKTYVKTTNGGFGDYFEYSKLRETIDNSDAKITSNLVDLKMYLYLFEEYHLTTVIDGIFVDENAYRFKCPKNLLDTTATGQLKKTYIQKILKSGYVLQTGDTLPIGAIPGDIIETLHEGIDYTVTYEDNSYITLSNFINGHLHFSAFDFKFFIYSKDEDIFMSEMELLTIEDDELSVMNQQV